MDVVAGLETNDGAGRMRIFNNLYIYGRFLEISIRSQMQYRLSFVLLSTAHFLTSAMNSLLWLCCLIGSDRLSSGNLARWPSCTASST
jgi:ABC-type uncharacterized transport system permease subunit